MSAYRISQLAELSGVPATTLRFYESAGLLPAQRTPSGYRVYDDRAVDRLAFISFAKHLGLALEDISALLRLWEDSTCTRVRDRLVPLVDQQISDAERRRAELAAFADRLRVARQELAGPAPEGRCGPDCGCTSVPAGSLRAVPVELTRTSSATDLDGNAWRRQPMVCSLTSAQTASRVQRWHQVMKQCTGRAQIPDGLRLAFPSTTELAGELAALAAAEQQCCAFFDFTMRLSASTLQLSVRAPEGAHAFLVELFGAGA